MHRTGEDENQANYLNQFFATEYLISPFSTQITTVWSPTREATRKLLLYSFVFFAEVTQ